MKYNLIANVQSYTTVENFPVDTPYTMYVCIPLQKVQCMNVIPTCPLSKYTNVYTYIDVQSVTLFCERASVRRACPHLCTLPQMHETYILRVSAVSELTYLSEWLIFHTSAACHINYYVNVKKITEKAYKAPKRTPLYESQTV